MVSTLPASVSARTAFWPRAVAWMLVAVTSVLLSFGALVTTYDAAMAVPDWPGTFGHNMLLFPLADWLWGPWDLFLEHGHRLLGAAAGALTVLLAAVTFRAPTSPALRWLVIAAVVLVVLQGALGGLRVILDDKTVAKVHACTGPLFFAVAAAIAVISGRNGAAATVDPSCGADAWSPDASPRAGSAPVPLPSWAVGASLPAALCVASYLQLVAGAQLRHADATLAPFTFRWMVVLHLVGAAVVAVLAALSAIAWQPHESLSVRRWSRVILVMVCCQLLLGGGAWIFTWGMPAWLQEAWSSGAALQARSPRGALVVTGHAVLGMLILGASVAMALEWGGAERLERLASGRESPTRPRGGGLARRAGGAS